MKRYNMDLAITALCFLLCGCARDLAVKPLPQWVLEPHAIYASSQYLTAVGEGDTFHAARTQAMGRLAGRFKTRVQSTERLSDEVQETFGGKQAYKKTSGYKSDIQLESDQTLLNVKTAEQFRDALGRVYVLVVLERSETAQLYEQSIADHARRIVRLATGDPSKLTAYAKRQQALKLGLKNQMLIDQLSIIDPMTAQRISLPYQLELLREQAAQATRAIKFRISLGGDRSAPLEQHIRTLMTARGFTAGSTCDLCIFGTLSIESMKFLRDDIRTVRYRVQINIKDPKEQTLLAMQRDGRESHMTVQEAYRRAERTVNELVENELIERLDLLLENLAGER